MAKEKAEREKQERQQKKRRLLEVNTGIDQAALAIISPIVYQFNRRVHAQSIRAKMI